MTARNEFDRLLTNWLTDEAGPADAANYLAETLELVDRTPQKPRWAILERWLPGQLTRTWTAYRRPILAIVMVALLTLALVAAALIIGSQRRQLPPPLGLANGVIAYDAGGQIYLANPDGSDPRPIPQPEKYAYTPVFSPDGTMLAYLSSKTPGPLDVFVANADGSNAHQVSFMPYDGGGGKFPPAWSPDGTRLVHYARDGGVWVMAADGSTQKRIGTGWSVAWSPDGEWIAFRADGLNAMLNVIHADGSGIRTLATADPNSDSFATLRWMPDSSGIVFHRAGEGIFKVDLDGNEERIAAGNGGYPTVSPDGRFVAFLEEIEGTEHLELVELATGEISTLSTAAGCLAVWAPDSTAVVTYANGCFTDIQRIPLEDPSAALTIDLPENIEGFPGWQAVAASAAPASEE